MSLSAAFCLSTFFVINCATNRNELRCGTEDMSDSYDSTSLIRQSRPTYNILPRGIAPKLQKTNISWKISKYPPVQESDDIEIIMANVDAAATTAFQLWSSACNLNFFQTDSETPDINLKFQRRKRHNRNCADSFEARDFAHYVKTSQMPHKIHINDDVDWTTRSDSADDSVNLVFLLAHEIGHALGFAHNNLVDSVMFNHYDYHSTAAVELSSDDIAAAKKRYGEITPSETTTQASLGRWTRAQQIRSGLDVSIVPFTAATIDTVATTTAVISTSTATSIDRCVGFDSCRRWNTADFKLTLSCSTAHWCGCISPGDSCTGGWRCCDGSICNGKCPPAAKFHYCNTGYTSNCQSGLICSVDDVSLVIFLGGTVHGRCLPDPKHCRAFKFHVCQNSSDCCKWITPEFKMSQSCGVDNQCGCISPGETCKGRYRCCDGTICRSKCPPAAKFHYCHTHYRRNCQWGLNCTVDSVSLRIRPGLTAYHGRCL